MEMEVPLLNIPSYKQTDVLCFQMLSIDESDGIIKPR